MNNHGQLTEFPSFGIGRGLQTRDRKKSVCYEMLHRILGLGRVLWIGVNNGKMHKVLNMQCLVDLVQVL
jgi:hypothetical protein